MKKFNFSFTWATIKLIFSLLILGLDFSINAQQKEFIPDLMKVNDSTVWSVFNRKVVNNGAVYLDGGNGDGILWLNDFNFANGRIELDIKGKNEIGKSFVGFAFHGLNDSIYDAIYFRPFNFKNSERSNHSVQYISHPKFTWYKLRDENPGKYENSVKPVPNPDEWFHATIVIEYPVVKVFVDNAEEPSLIINQLSSRKAGRLGFWVGNTSEGFYKNLKIISNL
jgi:hypothetical protein